MLGVMCSIPFDWYVRRWVELNLTFEIFRRMRVPEPEPDHPLRRRLATLSGRLSAHDERYADWAAAVSVPTGTLTNPIDRDNAIAEIDAVSALLYGLEWDDLVHIFETFHRGWDYTERLVAVQVHFDRWKDSA